jgi:hypothetical protein
MVAYRLATLALSILGAAAQNTIKCDTYGSVTPPGAAYQSKMLRINQVEELIDFDFSRE